MAQPFYAQYEATGGEPLSLRMKKLLARRDLEAKQARTYQFGQLAISKRAQEIDEMYRKGLLSDMERARTLQEEQRKTESLSGYMQLGALALATKTGQKVVGGVLKAVGRGIQTLSGVKTISPTPASPYEAPSVMAKPSYMGGGYSLEGAGMGRLSAEGAASMAEYLGHSAAYTPASTTLTAPTMTYTPTMTTPALSYTPLAGSAVTTAGGTAATGAGAQAALTTTAPSLAEYTVGAGAISAGEAGSAAVGTTAGEATATTAGGAGGAGLLSYAAPVAGGMLAGWGGRAITGYGKEGHMGGERYTSAGIGAVGGALAGAAIGTYIFPGIGTAVGAVIGGIVGLVSGGK